MHPDYLNHPAHADHDPTKDIHWKTMPTTTMQTDDYTTLTTELDRYTRLNNQLAEIEARFQAAMADIIATSYREEFAALTDELTESSDRIETLAIRHPEWFAKTKTIKTPFGTVASRSSTKLDVPNEEATIALLELRGTAAEPFLRTRKYLSVESLEALDDADLAALKIRRVTSEKITITPAKIDLGKAVKLATKADKEAATK